MDTVWHDLRHGARRLSREPGFAAAGILTLALGIGANTAIFSVVDGVLLKPLPYPEPDRLFAVHEQIPKVSHLAPTLAVSAHHFIAWKRQAAAFEQIAIIAPQSVNLSGQGSPQRVYAARASAALFPMLGAQPRLGRTFLEEEEQPGRDRVVLLSERLWRDTFAADPALAGKSITLDGQSWTVAGVLPASFEPPRDEQLHPFVKLGPRIDIWKPAAFLPSELSLLGDFNFGAIARLKRGVTLDQATAELNAIQAAVVKDAPEKIELKALLIPLEVQITGGVRRGLLVALAAVAAVLLIGCVNLANLLLARQARKARELAVRAALGAGRVRLIRETLAESFVLALAGGALGILLAAAGTRLLVGAAPIDLPRIAEVRTDWRVLSFSLALSGLTAVLFGLLPALRGSLAEPMDAMKSGTRTAGDGPRGSRYLSLLVTAEVALSAALLAAAGLLLASFVRLTRVDKGFDTQNLLAFDLGLAPAKYADSGPREQFYRRALESVRSIPGVLTAGMVTALPLEGQGPTNLLVLDEKPLPLLERPLTGFRPVDPAFFRTMGIALRRGRIFDESDKGRNVAVISESTAEKLWPASSAVGRKFRLGGESSPQLEVVGVVADIHGSSLQEGPGLMTYLPYWQRGRLFATMVLRTGPPPAALVAAARAAVAKVDVEVPLANIRTMDQVVAQSLAQRRFQMLLVLAFAAAALLLAALGIYSVVSYAVTQRTAEFGVRIAVGARNSALYRMVLLQGLKPVFAGLALGLGGALALGRLLAGLLFGVSPSDPATFAVVAAILAFAALAATLRPAARAASVDPIRALRYE